MNLVEQQRYLFSCINYPHALKGFLESKTKEQAQLLINSPLKTLVDTAFNGSPILHYMCAFTNPAPHINITVTLLLQFGADVNKIDEQKFTPLVYAVWNFQKDLTKLLLDNGANPHSALTYAKGDIMEMLQHYITHPIVMSAFQPQLQQISTDTTRSGILGKLIAKIPFSFLKSSSTGYQSVLAVSLVQLLEGKEGLVSESPQEFEKILSLFVEYDENNRKYLPPPFYLLPPTY